MGRLAAVLLVLILLGLGARVLFVDSRGTDDSALQGAPPSQVKPLKLPEELLADPLAGSEPQLPKKIAIVDPDPDLDQSSEPADCEGTPVQPHEPRPEVPAPH